MPTKEKEQSVFYELIIDADGDTRKKLEINHKNWQKIYFVGQNNISTLLGSYFPVGKNIKEVEISKNSKNKSPVSECLEKLCGKNKLPDLYRNVLAFVNWFPAEQLHAANKKYQVSHKEAITRFMDYWEQAHKLTKGEVGSVDKRLIKTILHFQFQENVSFIDRRKAFCDTGLNPVEVEKTILRLLDYKGAFIGATGSQKFRSVISSGCGKGKKNDPLWDKPVVSLIKSFLDKNNQEQIESAQLSDLLKKENLDIKQAGGRPSAYLNYIKRNDIIDVKFFTKLIEERLAKIDDNSKNATMSEPLYRFMINPIEEIIQNTLEGNGEFFYAAYSKPYGWIASKKSNSVDRILELMVDIESNEDIEKKCQKEIDLLYAFANKMAAELEITHYTIRKKQESGVDKFLSCIKQQKSFDDAVKDAKNEAINNHKKYPDERLLKFLHDNEMLDAKKVKNAIAWHCQHDKIVNKSYLGGLHDAYENNKARPDYGTKSKPFGKISPDSSEVEIKIINNGIENLKLKVLSKRFWNDFCAENVDVNSENVIPRNTKKHNPYNEPFKLSTDQASLACNIYSKVPSYGNYENWYIGVTKKLLDKPFVKIDDFKDKSFAVLGIDLGWRNIASYGVLCNNEVIERGCLEHIIQNRVGENVNTFRDLGKSTSQLKDLYGYLHDRYNTEEKEKSNNDNYYYMVKDCISLLYSYLRQHKNKTEPNNIKEYREFLKDALELANCVSPHFVNRYSNEHTRSQGGLSDDRIDMLFRLKKVMSSIVSKSEFMKIEVDPIFQDVISRIESKRNNLRREKHRLTTHMILKKALEVKKDLNVEEIAIAIEELRDGKSTDNYKSSNRKWSDWCVSRTFDDLQREAKQHGIKIMNINPYFSSHEDINGKPICRWEVIDLETIPNKSPKGSYRPSLESLSKQCYSYLNQKDNNKEIDELYRQEWLNFLWDEDYQGALTFAEKIDKLKKEGVKEVLIPRKGGRYSMSIMFDQPEESDIVASIIIARRAYDRICEHLGEPKFAWTARKS